MKKILVLFGTRPEAIKLAPVVLELRKQPEVFAVRLLCTGQHRQMVRQALDPFQLEPDIWLDAMSAASSLGAMTGWLFSRMDEILEKEAPDWLIVQGDTSSAMVGAVGAYYRRIKVAHVEAGLRTFNRQAPFPEEINRTFISGVADLHFAPTQRAVENLVGSGVSRDSVFLCGNTVVDALLWVRARLGQGVPDEIKPELAEMMEGRRVILVTGHRRESFGQGLEDICTALRNIAQIVPNCLVVYAVHLNANVYEPVHRLLANSPNIHLIDPVGYPAFIWLMQKSYIILTDSGGIQEEAPALGKPVLILRDKTERPEVLEAGCARLVGTQPANILAAVREMFDDNLRYQGMAQVRNPFGDGYAAARIVAALK